MQPGTVAHAGLDGVAKGVAQVKQGAHAGFFFVLANNIRLHLAAVADGFGQGGTVAGTQCVDVLLQPGQKLHIAQQRVFDHFGQAGGQLARGQGVQHGHVGQHCARLVKRADHIFAQRVIDGGFAAHRGIHLRQQGGGNLDERRAALVAGGGKAGHVANHPAAQRNQRGLAFGAPAQQGVKDQVQGFPGFVGFAVRQNYRGDADPGGFQCLLQRGQVQRGNRGVGDDRGFFLRQVRQNQRRIGKQGFANVDRVAGVGQNKVKRYHAEAPGREGRNHPPGWPACSAGG